MEISAGERNETDDDKNHRLPLTRVKVRERERAGGGPAPHDAEAHEPTAAGQGAGPRSSLDRRALASTTSSGCFGRITDQRLAPKPLPLSATDQILRAQPVPQFPCKSQDGQ